MHNFTGKKHEVFEETKQNSLLASQQDHNYKRSLRMAQIYDPN